MSFLVVGVDIAIFSAFPLYHIIDYITTLIPRKSRYSIYLLNPPYHTLLLTSIDTTLLNTITIPSTKHYNDLDDCSIQKFIEMIHRIDHIQKIQSEIHILQLSYDSTDSNPSHYQLHNFNPISYQNIISTLSKSQLQTTSSSEVSIQRYAYSTQSQTYSIPIPIVHSPRKIFENRCGLACFVRNKVYSKNVFGILSIYQISPILLKFSFNSNDYVEEFHSLIWEVAPKQTIQEVNGSKYYFFAFVSKRGDEVLWKKVYWSTLLINDINNIITTDIPMSYHDLFHTLMNREHLTL
ncbi:hypothetical protein QTN25_005458 [Entamoeba marina]